MLKSLIGSEWVDHIDDLMRYRLEFDRSEIRLRYGLPEFRGSHIRKYVDRIQKLFAKDNIQIDNNFPKPQSTRDWIRLAEDLDEQYIRLNKK